MRFFDQIHFYEVSADELIEIRRDFPKGQVSLRIENTEFSLTAYQQWLSENEASISEFTAMREQAFAEELQRWRDSGQFTFDASESIAGATVMDAVPDGAIPIDSSISGNVWKIEVQEGDAILKGQPILILESMKMEIAVYAQEAGTIKKILVGTGQDVQAGQSLIWLEQENQA